MTKQEMIAELAKEMPPYAANFTKEFIPGKTQVLYSGPFFGPEEIEAGLTAFLSGRWLVAGENVAQFQNKFARKFKSASSQMVNSGSSANLVLIASLKKHLDWQDGDEVIVSPTGFPTTIAPIVQNNLIPVFADIEWDTLNFDLKEVERKITKKTKAIFVSPTLGNSPDICELERLSKTYGVRLVLDGCDSLGSLWDGKLLNTYFYAWTTSFFPAHHLSVGEGGMISSDDDELIKLARSFCTWGRDCHCVGVANLLPCGTCGKRFSKWLGEEHGVVDHKYIFENVGWNLHPLDLQGAIGVAQLEKFEEIARRRRENKKSITKSLEVIPQVRVAITLEKSDPCWFSVPVICDSLQIKASLVVHLEKHLIQTRDLFASNILHHPAYRHLSNYKDYPIASKVLGQVFFLGCAPQYSPEIIEYIDSTLRSWEHK